MKESAISCLGSFLIHLGDLPAVTLPSLLLTLLDRIRNEVTAAPPERPPAHPHSPPTLTGLAH